MFGPTISRQSRRNLTITNGSATSCIRQQQYLKKEKNYRKYARWRHMVTSDAICRLKMVLIVATTMRRIRELRSGWMSEWLIFYDGVYKTGSRRHDRVTTRRHPERTYMSTFGVYIWLSFFPVFVVSRDRPRRKGGRMSSDIECSYFVKVYLVKLSTSTWFTSQSQLVS